MPRNVTVTFSDGSTHVYQNAPDDVTPEQITARASQDFGKQVTALDGGRGQAAAQLPEQPAAPADGIPNPAAPVWNPQTGQQDSTDNYQPIKLDAQGNPISIDVVDRGLFDKNGKPLPPDWQGEAYDADGRFVLTGRVTDTGPDNTANGPLEELGAVAGGAFRGLAALPDMLIGARQALFPNVKDDGSRWSDIPDMLGTKRLNSPGVEFAANVLGGMAVPGPKAAPRPVSAPANALAQAGAKAEQPAANALANPRAIVEAGKREGVRVMTSDVKPPRTFMGKGLRAVGERVPVLGTGGVRASQQEQRIEAARKLAEEYGAGTTLDDATVAVAQDFAATRGAAISSLTKAKDSVIDGVKGQVQVPRTIKAIDDTVAELSRLKADEVGPVIAKLKNWRSALLGETTKIDTGLLDASGNKIIREVKDVRDLRTIEDLRKILGEAFDDPGLSAIKGTAQKAKNAIYGPLRDDMGDFIKQAGGTDKYLKWKNANTRLAAMAQELDNTTFRGALNRAETTPEDAAKLIFSKKPSDIRRLYRNLSPAGRTKAQSAIILKAAEGAATDGVISPDKFKNAIEAMDNATGVFMAPADKARLDGFTRLMTATKRAGEAGVMTNSGQQAVPAMVGAAAVTMPWKVASVAVASRLYESAPVRDALLKLGRTKPGSPQEKIATAGAEKIIARYLAKSAPVVSDRIERAVTTSPAPRAAAEDQNK